MDELLLHTLWMTLTNIILGEQSQMQKNTYGLISFISRPKACETHLWSRLWLSQLRSDWMGHEKGAGKVLCFSVGVFSL